MRKVLEFLGLGRGDKNGYPAKDGGRRNLWLAGLAVLGIAMLVYSGTSEEKPAAREPARQEAAVSPPQEPARGGMTAEEESLSKKLCQMLEKVEGAGKVEVSVRLSGSTRAEYAVNTSTGRKTTEERDQSGGTRLTTEDTSSDQLVMNRSGTGGEQPVLEREVAPQVAGVLVVAEGAGDARVKAKLFEAARVALGIEPQRILVLPKERGKS